MQKNNKNRKSAVLIKVLAAGIITATSIFISSAGCKSKIESERKKELLFDIQRQFVQPQEFVTTRTGVPIAKGEFLTLVKANSKEEIEKKLGELENYVLQAGGQIGGVIDFGGKNFAKLVQIIIPSADSPEKIENEIQKVLDLQLVNSAFPNTTMSGNILTKGIVPIDPLFDSWDDSPDGNNWHFEFMKFPRAWEIKSKGEIKVGVIEFGIEPHEDLPADAIEGLTSYGADWARKHGVSVVGTLGAKGFNGKGIAGAVWRWSESEDKKILLELTNGGLGDFVQKLLSLIQKGAKVILFAGGLQWESPPSDEDPSASAILNYHRELFSIVFQYVRYYDVLFVQSAGNEGWDAKWAGVGAVVKDLFPGNILIVGSINKDGFVSSFSNWGRVVDVYAPGEGIFTLCEGNLYCLVSGTSYSAALVGGLAVLIRSLRPDLSAGRVKEAIMKSKMEQLRIAEKGIIVPDAFLSMEIARGMEAGWEIEEVPEPQPFVPSDIVGGGRLGPKAIQCAVFDNTDQDGDRAFNAPKCPLNSEACSSCGLLSGRNNANGTNTGRELNQPNVISTCTGADSGGNTDGHIESIQVEAMAESGFFEAARSIQQAVKVTIRAYCRAANDFIDILYTENADQVNPTWTHFGSARCNQDPGQFYGENFYCTTTNGGWKTCTARILLSPNLPAGRSVAVRARYQNSNSGQTGACYTGSTVRDHDDLVFKIQSLPSSFQTAVYHSVFRAPICTDTQRGWCGTNGIARCRNTTVISGENVPGFMNCGAGTATNPSEPNTPNTIYNSCSDTNQDDGNSKDEEVRRVNVKSLAASGKFEGGELVEVSALVFCFPSADQIIFLYASGVTTDTTNVNWRHINTAFCPAGGNFREPFILNTTLTLDNAEGWHAVRTVVIWASGAPPQTSACPNYSYRDADDLIFYVKAVPPSQLPVCASYDNTTSDGDPAYNTPKCPAGASQCSTCDLVKSRDNISTPEQNQPNTLSTTTPCSDQTTAGTYLQTESLERIEIKSYTGTFQPGATAEIRVLVNCTPAYPTYFDDRLRILYAQDANNPSWQVIEDNLSVCSGPGYQLFTKIITLGNTAGNHVIRAMFQRGDFSPGQVCATGTAGDTDDLVFTVGIPQAPQNFKAEGVSPDSITLSWIDVQGETYYELRWTNTYNPNYSSWYIHSASPLPADSWYYVDRPLPEGTYRCYALRACNANGCSSYVWDCATVPSLSANCATYDSSWKVPVCPGGVNNCSTCDLVLSRDSISPRAEQNTPNTWLNSCADQGGGTYFGTGNSIEKIILTTTAGSFQPVYPINITARVYCATAGTPIMAYYSAGTSPVSFTLISSTTCAASGAVEDKNFSFTPGTSNWYVIRVTMGGTTVGTCSTGNQFEADDVAVRIGGVPPVPQGFDVFFVNPDIARVVWQDVDGETYYRLVSAPTPLDTFTEVTPPLPADTTSYNHSGLAEGQSICFKLQACNGIGCSAFTSVKCTTRSPTPPSNLSIQAYSDEVSTQATFTVIFNDNSTNEDGFVIDRTTNGTSWTRLEWWSSSATKTGTGQRQVQLSLNMEINTCFRVASFKQVPGSGTLSLSSWADNSTQCVVAVRAPSSLQVYSTLIPKTLDLFWVDRSNFEAGYYIDYRLSSSQNWSSVSISSNSSYYRLSFNSEDVYYLRVTNYYVSGTPLGRNFSRGYSSEVLKLAMAKPSPLYTEASGNNSIYLEWQDNAISETAYQIQVSDGTSWSNLANTSPDTITYVHSGVSGRLCYRVRGVKGSYYTDWTEVSCSSPGVVGACSSSVNAGVGSSELRVAVKSGELAIGYTSTTLYGIRSYSGTVAWSLPIDNISAVCNISPSTIFVGNTAGTGTAYVIDTNTGTVLKSTGGFGSFRGCAVSSDGFIFATVSGGTVYKLNPSLVVVGSANAGGTIGTAPAIDKKRSYVFVVRQDGAVRIYNLNLSLVGSTSPIAGVTSTSSPAIGPQGEIYFGASDGRLYKVLNSSGVWTTTSVSIGSGLVSSPVVYANGTSTIVLAGAGTSGQFSAVNGRTMGILWSQTLASGIQYSAGLGEDTVFLASGNTVYGRRIADGQLVCSYTVPGSGNISSNIIISGQDVIFSDTSGRFYVLNAGVGEAAFSWIDFGGGNGRREGGQHGMKTYLTHERSYCPVSGGRIYGTTVADVDGDGTLDIVGVWVDGGRIYAIRGDTGQILWSAQVNETILWSIPAVGDTNADGVPDVVIGTESNNIYIFNGGTGAQISSASGLCGKIRAISLANLDNDSSLEIIAVATNCNSVYVLDWNGFNYDIERFNLGSGNNNSFAVAVNSGSTRYIFVTDFSGRLHRIDYTTKTTSTVTVSGGAKLFSPTVADIDGDGQLEVVFASNGITVYAYTIDMTQKWAVNLGINDSIERCPRGAALSPRAGGGYDLIFTIPSCQTTSSYSYLAKVTGSGNSGYVNFVKTINSNALSVPGIVDIDGDGKDEYVVLTDGGYLYGYRSDGSIMFAAPYYITNTSLGARGAVNLADVDGDGNLELVFGNYWGSCIVVFEAGGSPGATDRVRWSHFRGNKEQNALR